VNLYRRCPILDKDWLVLVHHSAPVKTSDSFSTLLGLMNQIDSERGVRLTDEQADSIQKLIAALIDQIRASKNKRK